MKEEHHKLDAGAPILISIVAGILSTVIAINIGGGPRSGYSIWLSYSYPALLVLAVFLGYKWPDRAWRYGVIAVISSYVTALFILPGAANLLPFQIILEAIYSIPAAFSGWLGSRWSNTKGKVEKN